jgi:hypothetical protein
MISEVLLVLVFEGAVMSVDASVNGPALAGVPQGVMLFKLLGRVT